MGVRFPGGDLRHRVQIGSGAHPAYYPVGTGVPSPGVSPPGREADHLPLSNAEVRNAWSYISTPQYLFMVWC